MVLTTLHNQCMKHVDIKRTLVKQLHDGDALSLWMVKREWRATEQEIIWYQVYGGSIDGTLAIGYGLSTEHYGRLWEAYEAYN